MFSGTLERQMDDQLGLGRLDQKAEANRVMITNKESSQRAEESHEYMCTHVMYVHV